MNAPPLLPTDVERIAQALARLLVASIQRDRTTNARNAA